MSKRNFLWSLSLLVIFLIFLGIGVIYSKNKQKISTFTEHRLSPGCKLIDSPGLAEQLYPNEVNFSAPYYLSLLGHIYKTLNRNYSVEVDDPLIGTAKKISEVEEPPSSEFSLQLKKKGNVLAEHKLGVFNCVKFQVDLCTEFDHSEGAFVFFTSKLNELPDEVSF